MSNSRWASQRGASLISVLVAAGLVGVVALVGAKLTANLGAGTRRAELRGEREVIRSLIYNEIDCAATFATAGIDPAAPGGSCTSTSAPGGQSGPYLRLARRTADGNVHYLTDVPGSGGAAKVGDWSVRVSCSAAEQSLVVRVARPISGGGFARDPLNENVTYNWNEPRGLLYGGSGGAMPLCFGRAGGVPLIQTGIGTSNSCDVGFIGGLCQSGYHVNVTFPTPFSTPPQVMVTPNLISAQGGCVGGATDQVRAIAANITTTGFKMYCSGSPEDSCGVYEGYQTIGRCNWMAIGQP